MVVIICYAYSVLGSDFDSRYMSKKKKKKKDFRPTDPTWKCYLQKGNTTIFFIWPYRWHTQYVVDQCCFFTRYPNWKGSTRWFKSPIPTIPGLKWGTVKWFLDVKTAAALEREGSRDQSTQPTTARSKSGAVAASWNLRYLGLIWLQHQAPLYTPLKSVVCRSSQEAAYTRLWNFTFYSFSDGRKSIITKVPLAAFKKHAKLMTDLQLRRKNTPDSWLKQKGRKRWKIAQILSCSLTPPKDNIIEEAEVKF